MDSDLRQLERELDLDPENVTLIERFVSLSQRSNVNVGDEGDEVRESIARRLSPLKGCRSIQLETALNGFQIPFKRTKLVEGETEWAFALAGLDCAGTCQENELHLTFFGKDRSTCIGDISTRRLVDLLAKRETVPSLDDGNLRNWAASERYRFLYGLSMACGAKDSHDGFEKLKSAQDWVGPNEPNELWTQSAWPPFFLERSGIKVACYWQLPNYLGELDPSDHPIYTMTVVTARLVASDMRSLPVGYPGALRCLDTGEQQFWTALDLIDAADVFAEAWQAGEQDSPEAFMTKLAVLGIGGDLFERNKYDSRRYKLTFMIEKAEFEIEFVQDGEKHHAKLWAEPADRDPFVLRTFKTPKEALEWARRTFLDEGATGLARFIGSR